MSAISDKLAAQLAGEKNQTTYAVLDGAGIPNLLGQLAETAPPHFCLYRGALPSDVAACAPYLVELVPGSPFGDWVFDAVWGNNCGIFAVATAGLIEMRKHFRKFLMVKDPDGRSIYFRYYDPRVLRVYLPTCNAEEADYIYGPIRNYGMEDDSGDSLLKMRSDASGIQVQTIPLG